MLITSIIIFTVATCSAIKVATTSNISVPSIKLKHESVHTGHDSRGSPEQFRATQSTPRPSSPQDISSRSAARYRNAKSTETQRAPHGNPNHRSGSHPYGSVPARPASYTTAPNHQIESHRSSPLAPHLNILSSPVAAYKAATSAEKLPATKSIVSQSLRKLQGVYSPGYNDFHRDKSIELPDFSSFEYPSYSSIGKIMLSEGLQNDAAAVHVPVYRTDYAFPKFTEYAPSFPTISSGVLPLFQSVETAETTSDEASRQSLKQSDEATVDVNGKKISLPVVQLQSNPALSAVFPVFESQPFLLSANYPIGSDLAFDFEDGPKFSMAVQSRNASPFSSPLSSFQGQVVPIHTASSTPQFPQYKGASIEVYPAPSNIPKVPGSYEPLYNQPQLHFGKEHRARPVNVQHGAVRPATPVVSMGDILNDVELVNKKNPEPHRPETDENEEDDDERYKTPEKEDERISEDDDGERESGKHLKRPPTESDFKPSTSYPFKEYDETFGKNGARAEESEDKSHSSYKNQSSSDDDEEEEDSSSEYAESPKASHDSYEEEGEDEEESHKHEKQEEADEDSREARPEQFNYGKDLEREFEESYREELPKHRYEHVKEVPEIDSYNNPKPSRRRSKSNSRSRANHERSEEADRQESRLSRQNRKVPRTRYSDSAAHASDTSAKRAPKVIYEEFFGYKKNPESGKYSKRAKAEAAYGKYSPAKNSLKEDSYLRAAKHYKSKSPKTDGGRIAGKNKHAIANNNWKSGGNAPEKTIVAPRSKAPRQLPDPGNAGAAFYGPGAVNGARARSLTNAEILRDLTGI